MAEPGLPTRELILWDGTVPASSGSSRTSAQASLSQSQQLTLPLSLTWKKLLICLKLALELGQTSQHIMGQSCWQTILTLACEKFVHTLHQAAGPRSWPHVLAEEPMVLFMTIKMSGSSVRSDQMPMPAKPSCPILPGYLSTAAVSQSASPQPQAAGL